MWVPRGSAGLWVWCQNSRILHTTTGTGPEPPFVGPVTWLGQITAKEKVWLGIQRGPQGPLVPTTFPGSIPFPLSHEHVESPIRAA